MDDDQQFCLRWNNHQTTLISVFDTLLEKGMHVDCSLAAEGKTLKAHKVVLSACSPYFENVLSQQYDKHPIIILKDVKYAELRAMMDYMYRGEVNISQDQLAALLKAAESLQIKGLSDNKPPRPSSPSVKSKITESVSTLQSRESSSSPVPRKRKKPRRTSTDVLNHNHNEPLPTTAAPQTQTHTPLALPLPHPVPLAIPIAIPPSTPVIKPATEPINLNLENNIVPPTSKLKMSDIMNNITKNNKVDNNNMELGVAKLEFGSEGPEESVEDLTLDEEGEAEGEGGEEEEAGSSKYGDIVQNFQCYMERSQDEAALSGQDGPRDSQDKTEAQNIAEIFEGNVPLTRGFLRKLTEIKNETVASSSMARQELAERKTFKVRRQRIEKGKRVVKDKPDGRKKRKVLKEQTIQAGKQTMRVGKQKLLLDQTIQVGEQKVLPKQTKQAAKVKVSTEPIIKAELQIMPVIKKELKFKKKKEAYLKTESLMIHKCFICGKEYKYRRNMLRHEKYECLTGPMYQCMWCLRKFSQNKSLQDHLRRKHTTQ